VADALALLLPITGAFAALKWEHTGPPPVTGSAHTDKPR
jgi:hypothetical protein